MADAMLVKLLETLLNRTQAGKIKWEPGAREDTFLWSGSGASVILSTEDADGRYPFVVQVVNENGTVIERESYSYDPEGDSTLLWNVSDLYDAARATALDIRPTIEGLLKDLE